MACSGGLGAVHFISSSGRDQMPCTKRSPCLNLGFVMQKTPPHQPVTIFCSGVFTGQESTTMFNGETFTLSADEDAHECTFRAGNVRSSFLQVASESVVLSGISVSGYGRDQNSAAIMSLNQDLNITNCTFQDNMGSAVFSSGGTISVYSSSFLSNSALDTGERKRSDGGALYMTSVTAFIADSKFVGNRAGGFGGALSCTGSSCRIYGSSFSSNVAPYGSVMSNS